MHRSLVRIVAALALAALSPTAFAESTIKRYMFSAQKAEDVNTELGKMKVKLSEEWKAPARGQPMRITGVGSSGFPTSFLIEQAAGGFHVYAERRRPQHPRIGIIGHSEGGIVASMVAAQAPADVRFIVMLGGTGLPGIDIKSLQDAAARRAEGMDESLVLLNRSQERELFEIAASGRTRLDALVAMRMATHALPAATRTALEIPPEGIPDEAFEALLTPWFRRFLSLDPRQYLNRVTCPVLASEYFVIEETVAPSALTLMSAWMKKLVGHE